MAVVINWGSIGCGDVCERKAGPALYGVENSRLMAVMRRDAARAADFAQRHNVPRSYDALHKILDDPEINAIYVATPNNTHEVPTIAAAKAGKHVLVEKPMAKNRAACQRIIDVCEEEGVILAVAYYRRGYPTILRAKELMDAGEIGHVKAIWINDEFPLSHRLDLVHFFSGDAEKVWATEEDLAPGSHAERGAVLHVLTQSGTEGIMNIGWEEKLAPETVYLQGENGEIRITDIKKGTLEIVHDGQAKQEDLGPLPATHWGLVDNFVKHVNGEVPLACDGLEGRKSTVIMDIAQELSPGGSAVTVDYS